MHHVSTIAKPPARLLIESPVGNIFEPGRDLSHVQIDWLDLEWWECRRRANRCQTRSGRLVSVLLSLDQHLQHGDILDQNIDGGCIVVNLLHADVLVIHPRNFGEGFTLAYELGNLHVPIETTADEILTPFDTAIKAMLQRLHASFNLQVRQFQPTQWPEFVRLSKNFEVKNVRALPK